MLKAEDLQLTDFSKPLLSEVKNSSLACWLFYSPHVNSSYHACALTGCTRDNNPPRTAPVQGAESTYTKCTAA